MRLFRFTLPILFLYLPISALWSQSVYSWKLTKDNGLPSNEIYGLFQDSKGNLWIGTDGGICYYDGISVQNFSNEFQTSNSNAHILEDSRGRIWFKNFNGQFFYIENDTILQFNIPDEVKVNPYVEFDFIGDTVLLLSNKVFKYLEEDSTIFEFKGFSLGITSYDYDMNDQGDFFLSSLDYLYRLNDDSLEVIKKLGFDFRSESFCSILSDEHVILTNSVNKKIEIINVNTAASISFDLDILNIGKIYRAEVRDSQTLYIGSSDGLFEISIDVENERITHRKLLFDVDVSEILFDREGNLVVGTLGAGVWVIPSTDITYYDPSNSSIPIGKCNELELINQSRLLIGHSDGYLSTLEIEDKQFNSTRLPIKDNVTGIFSLPGDDRAMVCCFRNFVCNSADLSSKMVPGRITGYQMSLYQDSIFLVGVMIGSFAFSFDDFEMGTRKLSLDHIPYKNIDIIYPEADSSSKYGLLYRYLIRSERTNAIMADNKNEEVWISYYDSLYVYSSLGIEPIQVDGIGNIRACDIMKGKDEIVWVATFEQGLFGFKNKKVVHSFTDDTFFDNTLVRSMEIQDSIIWLASDKGVSKINYVSGDIQKFDQLDGLVSNEVYDIAVFKENVYVATSSGLVTFDVNASATNKTPPLVHIRQIKVNNQRIDLSDESNGLVQIPFDKNSIEFKISGSSMRSRGAFYFKYRLLGLDSSWYQQSAQANIIRYQGLNSGVYTLEVVCVNEDGLQSNEITDFTFSISKPFYQTIWFYLIILSVVGLLVYLIAQLRYQRIQNKLIIKNSINQLKMQALQSQMNPHFVFNAMTAIQSFWMQDKKELALNYHAQFARLMRLIFEYSKENKIHIEDEIEFLQLYVNLELMRFGDRIDVHFNYDETELQDEIYIPPLILQPLIENSFKHGLLHKEGKGHLLITMKLIDNYLYCSVEDDGVGVRKEKQFMVKDKKRYSSTIVIKERLDILNGVEGQDKSKNVFIQTDNPSGSGGFKSEIWVPINI